MGNPKRARSWKRRIQPRVGLKAVEPVLYSTYCPDLTRKKAPLSGWEDAATRPCVGPGV